MECKMFAPTQYSVAKVCDSLLHSLHRLNFVKYKFEVHDFYYPILKVYVIFSKPSEFMLQNEFF